MRFQRRILCVVRSVALAVACTACILFPYIDRELSGPVTLDNKWLELTPKEPLRVQRDTQEVTLFPDPPIKTVNGDQIPAVDIEAELIDNKGEVHRSSPGLSETLTGNLQITSRSLGFKELPGDLTFTRVRIRSSAPYHVKKILWRCYNWSDARK